MSESVIRRSLGRGLFLGGTEDILHGVHQRVGALPAQVPEVVQVEGPDHAAPEALVPDVVTLAGNGGLIVKAHPLVSVVGIGAHPRRAGVILNRES